MLDALLVLYEQDVTPQAENDLKIRAKVRTAIWQHMLGRPYPFPHKEEGSFNERDFVPPDALPDDSVDHDAPPKEYFAPTDPAAFEEAGLDAPLGGGDDQ